MKVAEWLGKIDVVLRSLTPLTVVKWLGTIGVILAAILRALGYHVEDMVVGSVGTALWVYAAYKGRDTALLTCNLFILTVLIYGIVKGVGV